MGRIYKRENLNTRIGEKKKKDEKNEQDIIAWIEDHAYDDCLKYSEPEIRKDPLKKLINSGVNVPFASVEKRNKGSLK